MRPSNAIPQRRRLRPGNRARFCLGLASCLLLTAAAGCEKPAREQAAVPVKVKLLAPEEITVSARFSGSVEPLQTTELAFKIGGTVQSLYRPAGLDRDVIRARLEQSTGHDEER